jgi:hypothetical protein
MHVQGKVHMIVGDGGNIVVQAGDEGVLVIDTGLEARARTSCSRRFDASPTSRFVSSSTRTSMPTTPARTRRSPGRRVAGGNAPATRA